MVGSSRNRMAGSCSSAAAISQRMRWPSDSWRTGWSSSCSSRSSADQLVAGRADSGPAARGRCRAAGRSPRSPAGPTTAGCAGRTPRRCAPRAACAAARATRPSTSQRPALGSQDAGEDLDGGRLAGAVRPDEARAARPRSSEKLTPFSASIVRQRRWNRPLTAPHAPGVALGDAIGLGETPRRGSGAWRNIRVR